MARLVGLERVTASAQLQKSFPRVGIQPLPEPYKPGRVTPADLGITDPGASLSFFVLGDVGGVKAPGAAERGQLRDGAAPGRGGLRAHPR